MQTTKGGNPPVPRLFAGQSRKTSSPRLQLGWRWLAPGIRGSALKSKSPRQGRSAVPGARGSYMTPHPEEHLVVACNYSFSGCSSAWSECALWKRDADGSNPSTQTNSWKVHYSVGEHTVNVPYVGSSPTFPASFEYEYPREWPWRNDKRAGMWTRKLRV